MEAPLVNAVSQELYTFNFTPYLYWSCSTSSRLCQCSSSETPVINIANHLRQALQDVVHCPLEYSSYPKWQPSELIKPLMCVDSY